MAKKHIIREVDPEITDFSFYFEDDGLTSKGGDYCNNLFIIGCRCGFNMKEYNRVKEQAEQLINDFEYVSTHGCIDYSYKKAMEENEISYNPKKCHALKLWAEYAFQYWHDEAESIADFLSITTGEQWKTDSARGYCQGDYVDIIYCPKYYKNGVRNYGEIFLGAGKEFCVITINDDGEEEGKLYGFIVADCEVKTEEDYKALVCDWAGISEEETALEMLGGWTSHKVYNYRAV